MAAPRQTTLSADLIAALAWWREAGVDGVFDDAPQQWIIPGNAQDPDVVPGDANMFPAITALAPPLPAAAPATIGGDRARWPVELSGFAEWWQQEPSLDAGQSWGRVPPRGPIAAPLMVLVAEPEAVDGDILLSGPQGRLLAAMLMAMGLSADQVYFASALPRHTPIADWADLVAQGLGEVLRHHLALARPRRVIAFGRHLPPLLMPKTLESPLEQHASAQSRPVSPDISHDGVNVPLLVARDLGSLLERPIAKGSFWRNWLEWNVG